MISTHEIQLGTNRLDLRAFPKVLHKKQFIQISGQGQVLMIFTGKPRCVGSFCNCLEGSKAFDMVTR